MGWRDAPTTARQVEIRGHIVTVETVACSYTRGERYQADTASGDLFSQARCAIAFIAEHVVNVPGADYPGDFDARCQWWGESLDLGESLQLAAFVMLGDLSGKSVRRVNTQS